MNWNAIWQTKTRVTWACAATIFILSSVLFYAVDWYWFYDTKGKDKLLEAEIYFKSVKQLLDKDIASGMPDTQIAADMKSYISQMKPYLEVSKNKGDTIIWKVSNDVRLDASRTLVHKGFDLDKGDYTYVIWFKYANRPPFATALVRAWTWSVADLVKDSDAYFKYNLYNRSTPLYSAVIIVALLAIQVFKLTYREKQEQAILKARLKEISDGKDEALAALAEIHGATIKKINDKDIELLHIAEELVKARTQVSEASETSLELISELESKLSSVELEKEFLVEERNELQQAKEALQAKYSELEVKVFDAETALNNLQSITAVTLQIDNAINGEMANNTRLAKDSRTYNKLKTHLKQWIIRKPAADINIGSHGTKKVVTDALEKIDSNFVNEFFTHVSNDMYSGAERGTIKVAVGTSDKDYSGYVTVYLTHDTGCSLSFAYNVRKKAPATNIGFVLAVLLRATCKDFEGYTIKGVA